ncbi:MAG: thioredoxin domain-containing protein [Polyangiaceae bacterium]
MWTQLKISLLTLAVATSGSTCRGQSDGGGTEVPKEASAARDTSLPGVDTSALTPREKNEWAGYVNEFLAPCADTPVSIAQCIKESRACSRCLPAAKYVLKGVRDGQSREQIEKSFQNRFDAKKVQNVPIEGSPSKGPESAPIVVVEFADFECPFCAAMAPTFEKVWEERKDKVRFVYKFMPLPSHPHGEIAARAGFAAAQQGKFWELNKKMFGNREHLEESDLQSYAKDLGLDLAKFKADMTSQAATDRIAQDRKLADTLNVKGTPTVYVNGREFDVRQDLGEWIQLELQMMSEGGGAKAASPAPSSSAAATASAAPSASAAKGAAPAPSASSAQAKQTTGKPGVK